MKIKTQLNLLTRL